jgi:hyperosmotically inducible protein
MNTRHALLFVTAALAAFTLVAGCNKSADTLPAAAAASQSGVNVTDIDVSEHVKTALRQSESLKGFNIIVVTLKGDVRLTGVVNSQAQIDEAIKLARAADGAHSVHDELTLKK